MKHAIIILAHKESETLVELVKYFDKDCDVFIHFDKKAKISDAFLRRMEELPQVIKIFRRYAVYWGGFSMLRCEMYLMKNVLKMSGAGYIHLLSGQDYPIKPLDDFLHFFDMHYGLNFLSYTHLPHSKWQRNTYNRLLYFYPTDLFSSRERSRGEMGRWVRFQRKLGVKRSIPTHFDHLYGGSQWFSLTRIGVTALLKYTSMHKWFYWRFMFTFAPEEVYIQTVLLNILPKDLIFPHNYRLIRWKEENGNKPSNLGKEHFHLLAETMDLFARKFESPYAENLVPLIDRYLLKDGVCDIGENGAWIYDGYRRYGYENAFVDALARYLKWGGMKDVVDVGCGAGFLVAALRRRGFLSTGFDANPYTPELSSRLLPQGDALCFHADLLEGIQVESPFDVAICLNVIQDIPTQKRQEAIQNLMSLTSFSLIVSFDEMMDEMYNDFVHVVEKTGMFRINRMATSFLRTYTKGYKNLSVLERI